MLPRRKVVGFRIEHRREGAAWATLLVLHVLVLACLLNRGGSKSRATNNFHGVPRGDKLTWFGGHPPAMREGAKCWCNPQLLGESSEKCSCTPSLAVDAILTSGPDHVWLVERRDTGSYACMGGFVDVGETGEQAILRELREETGIDLRGRIDPIFLGLYSDPRRDIRRPTASAIYVLDIPLEYKPKGGDDVKGVVRVELSAIDSSNLDFFADHLTILLDYRDARRKLIDPSTSRAGICR